MKEQVLQAIEIYEKELSGNDVKYDITDTIPLMDGATLYLFQNEEWGIRSSAIGYEDGNLFVMRDWQGGRPTTAEEVTDYPNEWVNVNGGYGVMIDGLPRIMQQFYITENRKAGRLSPAFLFSVNQCQNVPPNAPKSAKFTK